MSIEYHLKRRDAYQQLADAENDALEKLAPPEIKHNPKEYDALTWTEKMGSKGPYYQTTKEANNNSQLFQDLQQILKEHSGFVQLGGFKYWFDRSNEAIVDRRAK